MRHYTIREAARAIGVSVAVLRTWENRYAWPPSVRQDNGYRLYSEGTIRDARAFNAAGRPFKELSGGEWCRALPPVRPTEPLRLTATDDIERRYLDALEARNLGRVAFYLASLGRMRPPVRAQYVQAVQEANRQTGGAFAKVMREYQIEEA